MLGGGGRFSPSEFRSKDVPVSDSQMQIYAIRTLAMTPMLVVMLIGVIIAIRKLPLHPRSCWAILAAMALSGFSNVGLPVLMGFLLQITGGFSSTKDLLVRNFFWTLPQAILATTSWGLILFAVFDRPDPPKFLHEDDFQSDASVR